MVLTDGSTPIGTIISGNLSMTMQPPSFLVGIVRGNDMDHEQSFVDDTTQPGLDGSIRNREEELVNGEGSMKVSSISENAETSTVSKDMDSSASGESIDAEMSEESLEGKGIEGGSNGMEDEDGSNGLEDEGGSNGLENEGGSNGLEDEGGSNGLEDEGGSNELKDKNELMGDDSKDESELKGDDSRDENESKGDDSRDENESKEIDSKDNSSESKDESESIEEDESLNSKDVPTNSKDIMNHAVTTTTTIRPNTPYWNQTSFYMDLGRFYRHSFPRSSPTHSSKRTIGSPATILTHTLSSEEPVSYQFSNAWLTHPPLITPREDRFQLLQQEVYHHYRSMYAPKRLLNYRNRTRFDRMATRYNPSTFTIVVPTRASR